LNTAACDKNICSPCYFVIAAATATEDWGNTLLCHTYNFKGKFYEFEVWYFFSKIKTYPKKPKLILKNTLIDKTLTYASETSTLTKRDKKQLNIFERKVCRRILGPVYVNEKENWRIFTDK
jgi:hypothetical protein